MTSIYEKLSYPNIGIRVNITVFCRKINRTEGKGGFYLPRGLVVERLLMREYCL